MLIIRLLRDTEGINVIYEATKERGATILIPTSRGSSLDRLNLRQEHPHYS
jgi:hypothetical protein